MTLKNKALLSIATMGILGAAGAANAAILLNLNLQLHGGGSTQMVTAGTTYTLDIFVTPVGSDVLSVANIALGVKSQQSIKPLLSTLSGAAFVGTGWNTQGNIGAAKSPSFNGVVTDTDWGNLNGSVTGWFYPAQGTGTYVTSGPVDGVTNSVQLGTIQWTAPAILPANGGSVTLTAIQELNTAGTKGNHVYKLGTTTHSGALEVSSTGGTGTGVTFWFSDISPPAPLRDFFVSSSPVFSNQHAITQTVTASDMNTVASAVATTDSTMGEIEFSGLPTTGPNPPVLLLWLKNNDLSSIAGAASINTNIGSFNHEWLTTFIDTTFGTQTGPNAWLQLPVGATSDSFLAYNFGDSGNQLFGVALVPEPATLGLLAFGTIGLLRRRRGMTAR